MKKLIGMILFLLVLAGCNNTVEDSQSIEDPENKETLENTTIDDEANEPEAEQKPEEKHEEKPIEEKEAIAISKDVVARFSKMLTELGKKNGWDFEHPADYEVAKPELVTVATEEFADQELKEYVEEYYCNCDSGWFPQMDDQVIRVKTDRQVDSFTINGIVLPSFVSDGYELTMDFKKEEDGWKMDGWSHTPIRGKDLNLTKDEIQQAFPNYTVIGEENGKDGTPIVRMESDVEIIGISKKDGTMSLIDWK